MAKSKFEYVKQFELPDALLPDCGLIVRVDGHHFSRFVKAQAFQKPNDVRGLHLMNEVRVESACREHRSSQSLPTL
jgi:tRNA(His) guanylyltransferase